jgi:hypothetical protein
MIPSTAWFGECVPYDFEFLSESEKQGWQYLTQNHDKIFSLYADVIYYGMQLTLTYLLGIFLNYFYIYLMASCSEIMGIVTLVMVELLLFTIIAISCYFAIRSEDTARLAYSSSAISFSLIAIIFNCLLWCFWD